MQTVDLSGLPKEILTSKSESAMVAGISWAELLPDDRVVRLLVLHPDQSMDAKARTFLVFMHEITRLDLVVGGKVTAHTGPAQLDIDRTVLLMDGVSYAIVARMTASWDFFSQTHEF